MLTILIVVSDRVKFSIALIKECRVGLVSKGCSELTCASHNAWNVNHLLTPLIPFQHLTHLTLWHAPPAWRVFGQVEVVRGGVLLLHGRHVVKEELLLHRLLAGEIGDQLSGQKLPPGKESLPASRSPRSGHIHLHPNI